MATGSELNDLKKELIEALKTQSKFTEETLYYKNQLEDSMWKIKQLEEEKESLHKMVETSNEYISKLQKETRTEGSPAGRACQCAAIINDNKYRCNADLLSKLIVLEEDNRRLKAASLPNPESSSSYLQTQVDKMTVEINHLKAKLKDTENPQPANYGHISGISLDLETADETSAVDIQLVQTLGYKTVNAKAIELSIDQLDTSHQVPISYAETGKARIYRYVLSYDESSNSLFSNDRPRIASQLLTAVYLLEVADLVYMVDVAQQQLFSLQQLEVGGVSSINLKDTAEVAAFVSSKDSLCMSS